MSKFLQPTYLCHIGWFMANVLLFITSKTLDKLCSWSVITSCDLTYRSNQRMFCFVTVMILLWIFSFYRDLRCCKESSVAYLQRSVWHVGRRLARAANEIVMRLVVLWRQWGRHFYIRLDERSDKLVNLRCCLIDRTQCRNSREFDKIWSELGKQPVDRLKRDVLHGWTARSRAPCAHLSAGVWTSCGWTCRTSFLQAADEHMGEYSFQARNVGETAIEFVADLTCTAACRWDRDRQRSSKNDGTSVRW